MADGPLTPRELRNILFTTVIFAVVVFYVLRFIAGIATVLIVFAVAVLLAIVLNPLVTWAEKHKVPRGAAVAILALCVIGFVVFMAWEVIPLLVNQFRALATELPKDLENLRVWAARKSPGLARSIPLDAAQILDKFGASLGGVLGYALSVVDVLASIGVVLVTTLYLLVNPRPVAAGLLSLFPRAKQDQVVGVMQQVGGQMKWWAAGTALGMLAIFALTWGALTIIGVQPAFLFAVIAGFMELVPIVGPIISAFPPMFAALAVSPAHVLYVIVTFIIIQQIENHLIVPMVQSKSLKLHPVSVVFVVVVMAGLFGIVGVFLATPVAAVVKILYTEFYLKPMGQDEDAVKKRAGEIIGEERTEE